MKAKAATTRTRKAEPKSIGTRIVEKYRPEMSKLSAAERQRLSVRAMQLIWGSEGEAHRG